MLPVMVAHGTSTFPPPQKKNEHGQTALMKGMVDAN
jgi:hypothetical protein